MLSNVPSTKAGQLRNTFNSAVQKQVLRTRSTTGWVQVAWLQKSPCLRLMAWRQTAFYMARGVLAIHSKWVDMKPLIHCSNACSMEEAMGRRVEWVLLCLR